MVHLGLTPRETDVFLSLARGLTVKEIAAHLDIAVKTAETHRANVMRKLNVHRTVHIAHLAVFLGLVTLVVPEWVKDAVKQDLSRQGAD